MVMHVEIVHIVKIQEHMPLAFHHMLVVTDIVQGVNLFLLVVQQHLTIQVQQQYKQQVMVL